MDNHTWENISSKYIFKKILSYMKIPKALNIIKINKKIQVNFDILLFHYQYYYFYILFKNTEIKTINDILNSPYLEFFPEDVRYDLIFQFIEKRKLFKDEYLYLNFDKKNNRDFLKILTEKKKNNSLNYIIGNIEEEQNYKDIEDNYNKGTIGIFSMDIIDKILFDYNFFSNYNNNIISKNDFKNIKFLHINIHPNNTYDISSFENLEYLSITLDPSYRIFLYGILSIKLILTEKQMKNLKVLKIIESTIAYYVVRDIDIKTDNNNSKKKFESLEELYISEELLKKITFDSKKLKKLNIIYDFRGFIYPSDYFKNSINSLLARFSNLTNFNISIFYLTDYQLSDGVFIQEMSDIFFDLNIKVPNYSLNFWDFVAQAFGRWGRKLRLFIKILPNRKFNLIGYNLPIDVYQNRLDIIEKIDLTFKYKEQCNLYIEENSSISALKNISINQSIEDTLYIPIKSFKSLNSIKLNINKINFGKEFPLFARASSIIFTNLENIAIKTETNSVIIELSNNFSNVPNLRFLNIISKSIFNTTFPYYREIISKINILKKLHSLIIDDEEKDKFELIDVNRYYSFYPELKNTNVKYCCFSKKLSK